jgi:protein-disulfide isomerase
MIATAASALLLGACEQASDAAFGARVREYLLRHPEVLEEAMAQLDVNRREQAVAMSQARLSDYREALERDPRDFVVNPDGAITVVEFFDYDCPYCRAALPDILALIEENPDVRFVFKEYPIFGGDSDRAAALALAAKDDGAYMDLYKGFFQLADLNQENMDRVIAESGLDPEALKEEAVEDEVLQHLIDNHTLAQNLGVNGTPMFIIGDTVVPGADMSMVEQAIDDLRRQG